MLKDRFRSMLQKVIALTVFVGAIPFLFGVRVCADEISAAEGQEVVKKENKWLDDYHKPIGLTYNVQAVLQTAYLWRGMSVGAANIQASANVGYGGLYLDMWWNVGVEQWNFKTFQPEVDFSLGFARWGLNVYMLYIYNFNCGFFDFHNYPDKGNRLEINVKYTISSKLPLGILWATRVAASDGYLNTTGDMVRAWSSYAEIFYTQNLPYDLSLHGAVGFTPWKSCYTKYKGDFAVTNITICLRKDWSLSKHCGMMLKGQLTMNPYLMATDKSSIEWHSFNPTNQSINVNVGLGVYLK